MNRVNLRLRFSMVEQGQRITSSMIWICHTMIKKLEGAGAGRGGFFVPKLTGL